MDWQLEAIMVRGDMNEFIMTGAFKAPAGTYEIRVSAAELAATCGDIYVHVGVGSIKEFISGFAVPGKGGGYVMLYLVLKDTSEKTLLQSEGYDEETREGYEKLGRELAGKLNLPFRETSFGADA